MHIYKLIIQIWGRIISKRFYLLLIIIGIFFIVAFTSFVYSSQDFDGLFTMDVPLGKHYEDQSYCYQNKPLGVQSSMWMPMMKIA